MPQIIAQIVGLVAMTIALLSFQQKTQKHIVSIQLCSSSLFALHFFMLELPTGCLLNTIGVIRAFVYSKRDRQWANSLVWPALFVAASIGVYIFCFTTLGTKLNLRNLLLELLPVIGMAATTVSFRMKKASMVRLFSLISAPMWLIYNIFNFSLGGICTELFSLLSIIIGILRLDIKKKVK
jgi:hypothetical protein